MQQPSSCQLVYWYKIDQENLAQCKCNLCRLCSRQQWARAGPGRRAGSSSQQADIQISRLLGVEDLPVTPRSQWCHDSFEAGLWFYLAHSNGHSRTFISFRSFRIWRWKLHLLPTALKSQGAKILWSGPVMNRLHVSRRLRLSYSIAPSACMVGWL